MPCCCPPTTQSHPGSPTPQRDNRGIFLPALPNLNNQGIPHDPNHGLLTFVVERVISGGLHAEVARSAQVGRPGGALAFSLVGYEADPGLCLGQDRLQALEVPSLAPVAPGTLPQSPLVPSSPIP